MLNRSDDLLSPAKWFDEIVMPDSQKSNAAKERAFSLLFPPL
jgi:hypothetical protein